MQMMRVPAAVEHVSEMQNLPVMDIANCDLSWGLKPHMFSGIGL